MVQNHAQVGFTARTSKAHVIAFKHVNHLLARVQRDVGHARHRKRERGKHQVMRRIGQRHVGRRHADGHGEPDGEPPQLHGEDHQDEQAQPERGRGCQQEAIAADHAVKDAAAARAGGNAQHKPQHAADQPRDAHERQRVGRTVRNHLRHGRVEPKRRSHVAVQKRARPVGEPLPKRHIAAPIAGQLRALGLRHVHICGLPHVGLNRVDGRGAHQREHHQPHRQHEQHEPHDMSSKILRHTYLSPKSRNLPRKPFGFQAQNLFDRRRSLFATAFEQANAPPKPGR